MTWRARLAQAWDRLSRPLPERAAPDHMLTRRAALRPLRQEPAWTVERKGSGFAATDTAGRRAVGLARSAPAAEELFAALTEPQAVTPVIWSQSPEEAVTGRLEVIEEPGLGGIFEFVTAPSTAKQELRRTLPGVLAAWKRRNIAEGIRDRAHELDRTCPVLDPNLHDLYPDDRQRQREDIGRLRTFAWVEVDKVVGGGVSRWNDFDDHRPDTVPWIVQHVLTADDPLQAVLEAQADDVHLWADLERVPGPAGPMYRTGSGGRHRTHAMRILGVPWMVAEIGVSALPVLIEQTQLREPQDPEYRGEPIWRGLMERGLLVGDIVRSDHGPALQPYQVAAPWLLLSPRRALIASQKYQELYPNSLGIPAEAFASVDAWVAWCTGA